MKMKTKRIVCCIILVCTLCVYVTIMPVVAYDNTDIPLDSLHDLYSQCDIVKYGSEFLKKGENIEKIGENLLESKSKLYEEGKKYAIEAWKNYDMDNQSPSDWNYEWKKNSYPNIYILDRIQYYFNDIYLAYLNEIYTLKRPNFYPKDTWDNDFSVAWDHYFNIIDLLNKCNNEMYKGMRYGIQTMYDNYKFSNEDERKWYVDFMKKSVLENRISKTILIISHTEGQDKYVYDGIYYICETRYKQKFYEIAVDRYISDFKTMKSDVDIYIGKISRKRNA